MNALAPQAKLENEGCRVITPCAPTKSRQVALWRGMAAAALILAGCATSSGFRDSNTRISATTRFDLVEMKGRWVVRERVAAVDDDTGALPESFVFGIVDSEQVPVSWNHMTCSSTECVGVTDDLIARRTGPGTFAMPRGGSEPVEHWVLWADADYRVAAIGTPTGEFGWIMTKGKPRDDLMQAAREIMDWNGYDMARLRGVEE